MTARDKNSFPIPPFSPMKKRKLGRIQQQYKLMIKTHLEKVLKKKKRIPNTIRKILIKILVRKVLYRVLQTTKRLLSGPKRLLSSISIRKILHNVLNTWTVKSQNSKLNFLSFCMDGTSKAKKAFDLIFKSRPGQNLTNLLMVVSKSKDHITNLMSVEQQSFGNVLNPRNMLRTLFDVLSASSFVAKGALQGALARSMMKAIDSLAFENLSSSGVECVVTVSTWIAVSLAIPLLTQSLRLAKSETTKRLLRACLQTASTGFERLTSPVASRVSSYLHDLSPLTLSILSMVVPLLMTAPIRIAKSPLTHQLLRIAVQEVLVPGLLCVGQLAVRALTCSTTRCIISSATRHVFAQINPVLISTTLVVFMSSTAGSAVRRGISTMLNFPKSLTKEMLYTASAFVAQAVEIPVSNAKLCMDLKRPGIDRLLTLASSFIPVQVLLDIVGSLHAVGIDLKNQTMEGLLVPVLNSSTRVSHEIQSLSFSSLKVFYEYLKLMYSPCRFPKTLYGRKVNVAEILQSFNILSIEDLTKPEVMTTCVEMVQNLMRLEVRILLASALCEMLPQSLRHLLISENGVQSLCDVQSEPSISRVNLQAMIYSVLEVLMMPAVQKVLVPVLRDVIMPTVRAISSPAVHSIITNSRYLLPKIRIQKFLCSSERVQHYLLSSPRLQMIMAPTYEIKSALTTAKDCLELNAKTIKQ